MTKRAIKTIVITKHIHSCCASFSGGDVWVSIVTNLKEIDFKIEEDKIIKSKKFPALNGERVKYVEGDSIFCGVSIESDKTFYKSTPMGLHSFNDTPEFKELIQSYVDKGFSAERDIPEQKAYWERKREIEKIQSKKKGIVLWMGYEAYQGHPEYFQGGFSNDVFNSEKLKNYIGNAQSVHGWMGHSGGRTEYGDKLIEAGLRKRGISPSKMYNWISSSSGRHFGDSLEDCTKKEQKEKIESSLNYMYNCCILYGTPTHEGTLSSTVNIDEVFSKFNVLLSGGEKYNHKKHLQNLIESKAKISQQGDLSPELQYLSDVIDEIFANKV